MTTLNSTDIYGSLTTLGNETINGTLTNNGELYGINEYIFHGNTECARHWECTGLTTPPTANSESNDSWYVYSAGGTWDPGLLSRKRFRRCDGLTFEFEINCQGSYYVMLGFVDGNSTSFIYGQSPANLIYFHYNQHTYIFENGVQCSDTAVAYQQPNNVYKKFRIVLGNTGAFYQIFDSGAYNTVYYSTTNNSKYLRILINPGSGTIYYSNMRVFQQNIPTFINGNSALFMGGVVLQSPNSVSNNISQFNISNGGNTVRYGNLVRPRFACSAVSNGSYNKGIIISGNTVSGVELVSMEYTYMNIIGNSNVFGNIGVFSGNNAGCSNGTNNRGVKSGGGNYHQSIEYITISASPCNSTAFGSVSYGAHGMAGCSNTTGERGIIFAGRAGPGLNYIYTNYISYITISTPGNSTTFGTLATARFTPGACSNNTNNRGVCSGGAYADNTSTASMEYITITSTSNASSFGSLTLSRMALAGTSNGTSERGIFCGGCHLSWVPSYTIIDYITISTTGNATNFSSLMETARQHGGCSNAN